MQRSGAAAVPPDAGAGDRGPVVDAVVAASRALVAVAARSLAGLEEDVTLAQYRMLVLLCSRGPQRAADLAEALNVNPSTATRMTDRLVAKRLAHRQRLVSDRRTVRVGATSAGRELIAKVTKRRRGEIDRIISSIDPATRSQLVEALTVFSEAAGEVPEQTWSVGWQ